MRLGTALAAAAVASGPLSAATPQEKLERALTDRVPGVPVRCINPRSHSETRIFDKTAVLFGSGETIFLQKTLQPALLHADNIMVLDLRATATICAGEGVRMQDRSEGWERGSITLTEFIPYRRAE